MARIELFVDLDASDTTRMPYHADVRRRAVDHTAARLSQMLIRKQAAGVFDILMHKNGNVSVVFQGTKSPLVKIGTAEIKVTP